MIRILTIAIVVILLSGCNGERVDGGHGLISYRDDANGVICYRVDSRTLSCVKVK